MFELLGVEEPLYAFFPELAWPEPPVPAAQGGETLELAEFLVPRAEGAGWEVVPADLAKLQARRPDGPLEVADLEVDHFMAPGLQPPPQGRERVVVTRRGEAQDTDTSHGIVPPLSFG